MENTLTEEDLLHLVKQNAHVIQRLLSLGILKRTDNHCRDYHIGKSDYSSKLVQPWTIWREYNLDPWEADIVKRVLRHKEGESRLEDFLKIKHICEEIINQYVTGYRVDTI